MNQGKLKEEYLTVTSTIEIGPEDMARLGFADGDRIRLSNETGETIVTCVTTKPGNLPEGIMFMAYGPSSSSLMESDTAGTGMPLSKHLEVSVEKVR